MGGDYRLHISRSNSHYSRFALASGRVVSEKVSTGSCIWASQADYRIIFKTIKTTEFPGPRFSKAATGNFMHSPGLSDQS
jgi:hypothetical protein